MNNELLSPEESLARIKILIKEYYEKLGRDIVDDLDMLMRELIDEIDEIVDSTDLPKKYLIAEKLQRDNENGRR